MVESVGVDVGDVAQNLVGRFIGAWLQKLRWRAVVASAVLLRLVAGLEAASVVLLSRGRGQKLEAEATLLRQWDFAACASLYGCVLVPTSAAKLLEDQKPEARIHGCMTLTVKKILALICF